MNGNVVSMPPMEIAFQTTNKIITRLVTESIRSGNEQQTSIVYAGTHDGHVLKLVQRKRGEKFLLLTSWILHETDHDPSPVRNILLAQVR
jgi:hypothetical protein